MTRGKYNYPHRGLGDSDASLAMLVGDTGALTRGHFGKLSLIPGFASSAILYLDTRALRQVYLPTLERAPLFERGRLRDN
jgi:hypothetical protein